MVVKKKVLKTIYVDEDVADFLDKESLFLTKTGHGRSAVANEALKFARANVVSFESWWDNRDKG